MQQIRLGTTGTKVSRLCLGCMTYGSSKWRDWVLDEAEARPFIAKARDLGITFFDTADMYSVGASEEVLGKALAGVKRDEVVVATKVFNRMGPGANQAGLSRTHILDAIDASLRRLKMDYVDLYQIHRFDPETPIEETLEALADIVRMGKARYIGASSMWAWQFARMLAVSEANGWPRFVTMQNHWNLLYREEEREMAPLCRDRGVGMIPWSPLARGRLAGSREKQTVRSGTDEYTTMLYSRTEEADRAVLEALRGVAAGRGVAPARVALAWLIGKPGVTAPIVGASKPGHLEDAVAALEIKLEAEEIAALEAAYVPHAVAGHS